MMEFPTMGHLAQHFLRETAGELVMVREASRTGLEEASKLLLDEAVDEFGTYQQGAAPFGDWPELAPATKEDRLNKGYTENDPLLRSGALKAGMKREVNDFDATVGSEDPIMAYQELGTSRIPPRPVLGIALQRLWPQIQAMLGHGAAASFAGEKPTDRDGYEV